VADGDSVQPERSSRAGQDAFRFGHILIRDATYSGIAKEIRAELHERFADWLDESERRPYEEIVGYHFEQAYRYRAELSPMGEELRVLGNRASDVLEQAGQHALLRADNAAAVNLLDRARSLQSEHSRRLTLSVRLAEALVYTGKLEQARSLLNDVIEDAGERGDRRNEWLARLSYAQVSSQVVPDEWTTDRMKETAGRALRVFEALSDDRGLAHARGLAAKAYWNQNHYDEAATQYTRALAHARRTGDEREELIALTPLLQAMYRRTAHVSEVRRQMERYVDRVGEFSAPGFYALLTLAGLCAMEGAADESRRLSRRAKSIGEEMRPDWAPANTAQFAEQAGLLLGDAEFAERDLRVGYEYLEAMGERGLRSTIAAHLAEALYRLDRETEAEQFADLSLELASRDDIASQARGRVVKAKLLAAKGDYEAAYRLAREAVGLSDDTDDLFMQGIVLMALAEVLRLGGRDTDAIPVLRQAVEVSERKGNVVTAQEARALLSGLHAGTNAPRAGR
jgi:tetratricopeptide (TPR) repeat protein